ncbi:hypothetical protein llap_13349 [Limosa lapponica baueri]|uniref:Uncharacterized protein n=1 Tax=Limosa lapponica baueri TaxID=1758121 RepID=A0A2I0TRB5_LIMLA|nr:hypothetical protein llap_13349 [Limosa lapponica baueri]
MFERGCKTAHVFGSLIQTIDSVMAHMTRNLDENSLPLTLEGTSSVAAWITIVGLLYHNMHYFFHNINPLDTKIAEAAAYKGYMISATSYLISIKVEPLPKLSHNLSGSPLITIQLTHKLNQESYESISIHYCVSVRGRIAMIPLVAQDES